MFLREPLVFRRGTTGRETSSFICKTIITQSQLVCDRRRTSACTPPSQTPLEPHNISLSYRSLML